MNYNINQMLNKLIKHIIFTIKIASLIQIPSFVSIYFYVDLSFNNSIILYPLLKLILFLHKNTSLCENYTMSIYQSIHTHPKHISAKQLLKGINPTNHSQETKTAKIMPLRNTLLLKKRYLNEYERKENQSNSNQRVKSQYRSVEMPSLDKCRQRLVTELTKVGKEKQENKELLKYRRYKSIQYEEEEEGLMKYGKSIGCLRYLPKRGRILLNINSSRSNKALNIHESAQQLRKNKKLTSISVEVQNICNSQTEKNAQKHLKSIEAVTKVFQNKMERDNKVHEKSKSRRFLTEISDHMLKNEKRKINLSQTIKEDENSKKQKKIMMIQKQKKLTMKRKENSIVKTNQNLSIFEKYLSSIKGNGKVKKLKVKQKQKEVAIEVQEEQQQERGENNKHISEEIVEEQSLPDITGISSIQQNNESGFISHGLNDDIVDELLKTKNNGAIPKEKEKQKCSQQKEPFFRKQAENSLNNSLQLNQLLRTQLKSRKNILRSIDKIKGAFPKGFFQGL